MITKDILRSMDCLKAFTEEQLELLSSISDLQSFEQNDVIEKEGETCDAVYIVVKGRVAIQIQLPGERKLDINIVDRGNLFGWSAVVPPHTVTASSLCIENVEVIVISRPALMTLFKGNVELKAAFVEMIALVIRERLTETRNQLSYLLGWG